ncbi:MAG: site-2 protease family protein [Acholeplasmatales bacterium]|nr:site-2 protease family protein [Acholeplasmatales bacterium]
MFLALQGPALVIISIIAFVLVIGVIILIHEGGHFFFAKKAGILCHEFSLGMGPVIWKKKIGETVFSIRAIPIGGFVSMAGEEVTSELVKKGDKIGVNIENDEIVEIILDEKKECQLRGEIVDVDLYGEHNETLFITLNDEIQNHHYNVKRDAFYVFEKNQRMQITPYDRSFESKSLWQRFITIFAGPMMNFVLAIFIYLIVSFATGVPNYDSNVVGDITAHYPADGVLEAGDKIITVNNEEITSWDDFSATLDELYKENIIDINMVVIRDGNELSIDLQTAVIINSIGISNLQLPEEYDSDIKGVRLGNVAIRYEDDDKKGKYPLKNGDILTGVKINDDEYRLDNGQTWSDIIEIFKSVHSVADVRFEYYSLQKNDDDIIDSNDYVLVNYDECGSIEPYTDEVLENQRIEKIQQIMGVSPETHFDFFGCIGQAFKNFWSDFTLIFRTLKLLIAPSDVRQVGVSDLSGFVGIYSLISSYIGAGFLALMMFVAMLSVNIGVMNLLPIPALDGGRIVFLGFELVTRKKPSKKVENIINNIFFILLMLLFVYVTFNDITRLFK